MLGCRGRILVCGEGEGKIGVIWIEEGGFGVEDEDGVRVGEGDVCRMVRCAGVRDLESSFDVCRYWI